MAQYNGQLSNAMLDILELEHTLLVEPIKPNQKGLSGPSPAASEPSAAISISKTDVNRDKDTGGYLRQGHNERGDKEIDEDPTRANPKLSPWRRSAIHLLGAIIRRFLQGAYDGGSSNRDWREGGGGGGVGTMSKLEGFPARRALTILRYLAVHDVDSTVRELATEATDLLAELGRIKLGVMRG